jgi:hypothetical protein
MFEHLQATTTQKHNHVPQLLGKNINKQKALLNQIDD